MNRRKRMLADLDRDIRDHLDRETQDNIDRGMSAEDARTAALRKFGNVARIKEDTWSVWHSGRLERFLQDARFGWRVLVRSPLHTIAALLAISLGIGLNAGIFSVLHGAALRLLPVPHSETLVTLNQVFHGATKRDAHGETSMFSYPEFREYREQNHVFSGLVAYEPFVEAVLAGPSPHRLLGTATSCNYFSVFEESPALGRGFLDSDCAAAGENAVVVISEALWRERFGADPGLIGQRIVLNRTHYTVVGVAGHGFDGTEPIASAFWVPVTMQGALEPGHDRLSQDNMSWLVLIGRRRVGTSLAELRADLNLIATRIDRAHPGRNTTLEIAPATFFNRPEERQLLLPLASVVFGAFSFVLVVACANVASLQLARSWVRQKEFAIRMSIGAGRWRLVRQLLTESLLLSLAGGVIGCGLALWWCPRVFALAISRLPRDFSGLELNVVPNLPVLVYSLCLIALTAFASGLIPAFRDSRFDLQRILKGGREGGSSKKGSGRMLSTLVGCQVAASMVLLLGAGLLLRGLIYSETVHPGFETDHVAQVFLNLKEDGYDDSRATAYLEQVRRRLTGIPAIGAVAQAECAPLSHDLSDGAFTVAGRPEEISIEYNHVSSDFFSVLGIPIVRGRGFLIREPEGTHSVILTESTARALWPGQDPLGKSLREDGGREDVVIGIARDAQVSHLGETATKYLYFPAAARDDSRVYLLIRYRSSFLSAAAEIRDAATSIDPNIPVEVTRLGDNLEIWRGPSRIAVSIAAALGATALLLAAIGVFGMVSCAVNRSVPEIGIRMALGADRESILRRVLWQAMRPVLIGVGVGVVLSAIASRAIAGMLFGVSPHDPVAFLAVSIFLLAVAVLASYPPARRATRVDPIVALRYE